LFIFKLNLTYDGVFAILTLEYARIGRRIKMTFGWKKWTKKNLNRLESLLANGMPIENVRFRGRKKACIRRKARELGLIPTRGFPPFTKAQQKKLRQLIADNCPPEQIAEFEMLGKETKPRTVHNIRKWMGRLRLVNKNRSRSARKRKILTKRESRTLNAFLREHSTEFSIQQIARKFGIKKGTVDAKQRKLGVKPPFSIVLKIPSTRRKYLAGMCKRSAKMLAEFDFNITQRKLMTTDLSHSKKKLAKSVKDHGSNITSSFITTKSRIMATQHGISQMFVSSVKPKGVTTKD